MVTFAAGDAHSLGLNLEAQAALVFPERCSHPGFHPRRCNLSCVVELVRLVALRTLKGSIRSA
jgi:hypothetical protein